MPVAAKTRRSELQSSIVTVSTLLNTAILVFFSVYRVPYFVRPIKTRHITEVMADIAAVLP